MFDLQFPCGVEWWRAAIDDNDEDNDDHDHDDDDDDLFSSLHGMMLVWCIICSLIQVTSSSYSSCWNDLVLFFTLKS